MHSKLVRESINETIKKKQKDMRERVVKQERVRKG